MSEKKIKRYKKLCNQRDNYYWLYNDYQNKILALLETFTPEEIKELDKVKPNV